MADTTSKPQQEQNLTLRIALANAYAFVEGQKSVQSFAALTFEDLVDQQIELISGAGTDVRPNKLNRVAKILSDVQSAVAQLKQLPDSAFVKPDPTNDVNSPV